MKISEALLYDEGTKFVFNAPNVLFKRVVLEDVGLTVRITFLGSGDVGIYEKKDLREGDYEFTLFQEHFLPTGATYYDTKEADTTLCSCPSFELFAFGCKCGGK
jgi:hypothetical protein